MDTVWLEDFLALAAHANFSRAAEARNITQPAFSRRVRLLEGWLGVSLVDRSTHQITLTPGGERFRPVADEIMRRLLLGREEVRQAAAATASTVRFASTHALSLTFFPAWLQSVQGSLPLGSAPGTVGLVADHMRNCEGIMLGGGADFLLCHHHPAVSTRLDPEGFRSLPLGQDVLVPVSAPDADGVPRHPLPGAPGRPVAFLAFSADSGMGRILATARAQAGMPAWLEPVFTSHIATVLKAMARNGVGLAWAPLSLVSEDLAAGALVRAGDPAWDIPMTIQLFRSRSRQSQAAEAFWAHLAASGRTGTAPA